MKHPDTPRTNEAQALREGYERDIHNQERGVFVHPLIQPDGWAFARNLEREVNALKDGIRKAVDKHDKIPWGYDGDAGSNAIMSELEDLLDDGL